MLGIIFLMIFILAQLASAGGCGLNCTQSSRSVSTVSHLISPIPNFGTGAGGGTKFPLSYAGSGQCGAPLGNAPAECVELDSGISNCSGFNQTCDSATDELNALRYSKSGVTFTLNDAESRGNYFVSTSIYTNDVDGRDGILVAVADKSGNAVCHTGVKVNQTTFGSRDFWDAHVASIRDVSGMVYISARGGSGVASLTTFYVIVLNLTSCSLLNAGAWYNANGGPWFLGDAADDSTATSEGNNMVAVGYNGLSGYDALEIGFNSSLAIGGVRWD